MVEYTYKCNYGNREILCAYDVRLFMSHDLLVISKQTHPHKIVSTSAMLPMNGIMAVAQRAYADPTQMNDESPPRSFMMVGSAVEMLAYWYVSLTYSAK
jgi:hypothetical protein